MQHLLFTEDHIALQDSLKKFCEAEINPHIAEWEKAEIFPAKELFRKMGKLGFLGVNKPVEYGGQGLDYSYAAAFAEGLSAIQCGGVPMAIGVQTDMATPALARFGSDEVRREFLAPSISGDYVACLGVSEVGAGSDVASIKTHARKDGGDYVINGGKMWTTNGTQADWCCVLANTSEGASAHRNKTLICVPMKTPGVEVARKLKKAGMNSSDTAQLHFDNVRVPQRFRIGEEGMGFSYQMQQFQEERLWAAAGWRKNSRDHPGDHRLSARAPGLRQAVAGEPVHLLQAGRAADRGRGHGRAVSQGGGAVRGGQRRDAAGFDVQAEVRAPGPRSH